jgi:ribonuclease D
MHAVTNVACTKNMAKFVDENKPNSLSDLVKEFFGVVFNAN